MAESKMLDEQLEIAMRKGLNIQVTGSHGIGKTEVTQAVAKKLKLETRYFSLTQITHQDLIIPVPNHDNETIQYYFYKLLDSPGEDYTLILDEFNRCSVQTENAILEMVGQGTQMGRKLRGLRNVVALQNPDDSKMGYYTRPIDPVSQDRFHVYFDATDKNTGWDDHLLAKYGDTMVPYVHWRETLSADNKVWVTPRRVEKAYLAHNAGIPLENTFMTDGLPIQKLKAMIAGKEILTMDKLINDAEAITETLRNQDPGLAIQVLMLAKSVTEVKLGRKIASPVQALPKQHHIALLRCHRDRMNVLDALLTKSTKGKKEAS